jgi:hypothetical protein
MYFLTKKTGSPSGIIRQVYEYRQQRIEHHMANMLKLLELYAKSKSNISEKDDYISSKDT